MTKNAIFRKGSTTFFYSSLFFPKKVKEEVFTLYAYVRVIDDIVDAKNPDKAFLENLWNQTTQAWKNKSVSNSVVSDFIKLAKNKDFEWSWITAFWWAMRQDLVKKNYDSFSELEKYMYGSAEVIGLMMARILSLPREADEAAMLQGKAMQLINFIRDVKEDEELGRKYVFFGQKKSEDDLASWKEVAEKEIDRYYQIQEKAKKGWKYIPYRYLIPIKTAAEMYGWTAKSIKRDPQKVWQEKIKPSKTRIVFAAIKNTFSL